MVIDPVPLTIGSPVFVKVCEQGDWISSHTHGNVSLVTDSADHDHKFVFVCCVEVNDKCHIEYVSHMDNLACSWKCNNNEPAIFLVLANWAESFDLGNFANMKPRIDQLSRLCSSNIASGLQCDFSMLEMKCSRYED